MNYRHYFSLQVSHDFYPDQICSDFEIEPTSLCQRLLKGHRLTLKNRNDGFEVIAPINDAQQPYISPDQNTSFSFFLGLKQLDFFTITALDLGPSASDRFFYWSNLNLNLEQSLTDASISRSINLEQTAMQRSELANPNHARSNLENHVNQLLTLEIPKSKGIFGIIEIYNNGTLPQILAEPTQFKVQFSAKQKYWRYYLITESGLPDESFTIQDKSNQIVFEALDLDANDRILAAVQSQFPHSTTYLFQSSQPIPCQSSSITGIQLMKKGETKPWVQNLPNPPNHGNTQVINLLTNV